jgi:hypothetical protein
MLALKTIRQPWIRVGTIDATASAADVTLAVTERDFTTNKDLDNVVWKEVPTGLSIVECRFIGATNNHTYDVDVWVGRLDQGRADMTRVATLDVVCGQEVANVAHSTQNAGLYADTCTVSNELWIKSLVTVEGTDIMGRLIFDMCGYDLILFHGFGTFASDLIVELSGYH